MKKPKLTENSVLILKSISEIEEKTAKVIGEKIGIPLAPLKQEKIIEIALVHELDNRLKIWEQYTSKIGQKKETE